MSSFTDPKAITGYAQNAMRRVPGLNDIHRMAALLLAERTPTAGQVLVVGAGGGIELKCFAEAFSSWRFVGVDPSAEMLELAKTHLGDLVSRVQLLHGFIETAPPGPFDAASCLLTLHFTNKAERFRTLSEIHTRLKPGGALVVVHYSISQQGNDRDLWLSRCAEFAILSGISAIQAKNSTTAIGQKLPILTPEEDEQLMQQAGFSGISTFYIGLGFRGWVAYA
jgi:tRNA (cmo5U34)-methyltransferase